MSMTMPSVGSGIKIVLNLLAKFFVETSYHVFRASSTIRKFGGPSTKHFTADLADANGVTTVIGARSEYLSCKKQKL